MQSIQCSKRQYTSPSSIGLFHRLRNQYFASMIVVLSRRANKCMFLFARACACFCPRASCAKEKHETDVMSDCIFRLRAQPHCTITFSGQALRATVRSALLTLPWQIFHTHYMRQTRTEKSMLPHRRIHALVYQCLTGDTTQFNRL